MVGKELMINYKVFIPCAGTGARLGDLTKNINKALLSVSNKPVISHIIDKFDKDVEIVIALGYKGDYVKQFLNLAYPYRNLTFVTIDKYEGKGSGLGYTLNKCKKHLQSEFIFISNDTIIIDELPSLQKMKFNNWVGYSDRKGGNNYRSLHIDNNGKVIKLFEKNEYPEAPSYIGICGIKDYKNFWKYINKDSILSDINLQNDIDNGSIEPSSLPILTGESYAIQKMIKNNLSFDSIKFDWYDAGNENILSEAKEKLKSENEPNILEKPDESIWFVDDKVIKFCIDTDFIKNRAIRSETLKPYVPKVIDVTDNMYSYKKVNGTIFSEAVTTENFKFLLDWMESFHKPIKVNKKEFKKSCLEFYKNKTYQRIDEYFERFNNSDSDKEVINGTKVPSIKYLLGRVDWDWISDGTAVRFHGDLHFENMLVSEGNNHNTLPITLLDWRQDFCGNLEYGDVYYDLAKLMHGLVISHDIINDDLYSFDRSMNEIKYDFLRKNINIDCENIFIEYVDKWGYDIKKLKVMTSLIFLNIAKFHHYPYCHLLFYLGKNLLYNNMKD